MQNTAEDVRISDWSSDVCASDREGVAGRPRPCAPDAGRRDGEQEGRRCRGGRQAGEANQPRATGRDRRAAGRLSRSARGGKKGRRGCGASPARAGEILGELEGRGTERRVGEQRKHPFSTPQKNGRPQEAERGGLE